MNNERNKDRFESAEAKLGTNAKVQVELAKAEWQERYKSVVAKIYAASSTKELAEATQELQDNFDSLFELITAPGVEEFINWANSLTDNKNEKSTKKLKKFLVDNFTEYDNDIENVNAKKSCMEIDETSLFSSLIRGFRKKIKELVNKFLSKPDEFANNISALFNTLNREFDGVNEIEELAYTDISQLLPAQHKNNASLTFYKTSFDTILKQNQDFRVPGNENGKFDGNYYEIIIARIDNVKDSYGLLVSCGVAEENDDRLKDIFSKLEDVMLDTKGNVCEHIESFLEKTWATLKEHFYTIKTFEDCEHLTFNSDGWKSFEKASTIDAVIEDYNSLYQEKSLTEIARTGKDKVESLLKGKAKKISELKEKINKCCSEILDIFKRTVETYSNNDKKEMLTMIIKSNPSLQQSFDDIYGEDGSLSTIRNGIKTLTEDGSDFLRALSDETITTMIEERNNITEKFRDTIKADGLEDAIDWLESIGADTNLKTLNDFIKPLLDKGLITINIQKEF